MSNYPSSPAGYQRVKRMRPSVGLAKSPTMKKLTLKERIANWLTKDSSNESQYSDMAVESETINSNGMRFNLYVASGGYVVETRVYDEHHDRNRNKLYVITEDKDLGEELGKIITMESLR